MVAENLLKPARLNGKQLVGKFYNEQHSLLFDLSIAHSNYYNEHYRYLSTRALSTQIHYGGSAHCTALDLNDKEGHSEANYCNNRQWGSNPAKASEAPDGPGDERPPVPVCC
ncbi:hypothetical protein NL676_038068 [Syzygium grande]|nr:hypothetical protein NL676_038068 [Syzygium grande]